MWHWLRDRVDAQLDVLIGICVAWIAIRVGAPWLLIGSAWVVTVLAAVRLALKKTLPLTRTIR
jgi:hypothetical protein